jgi:hypothetical protein
VRPEIFQKRGRQTLKDSCSSVVPVLALSGSAHASSEFGISRWLQWPQSPISNVLTFEVDRISQEAAGAFADRAESPCGRSPLARWRGSSKGFLTTRGPTRPMSLRERYVGVSQTLSLGAAEPTEIAESA